MDPKCFTPFPPSYQPFPRRAAGIADETSFPERFTPFPAESRGLDERPSPSRLDFPPPRLLGGPKKGLVPIASPS